MNVFRRPVRIFARGKDASRAARGAARSDNRDAAIHEARALAARLPALSIEANRIASNVALGLHGARRSGVGEEFWQYRPAMPGEPTGRIDWRQSARSTHAWVRETEAESPQSLCLWCDVSPSMFWRSAATLPRKVDRALVLMLVIAELALRENERVVLPSVAGSGAFTSRTAMPRLIEALHHHIGRAATDANVALPDPAAIPRHARTVMISDFQWETPRLRETITLLAARPSRVHLAQVLDPAEIGLPFTGRIRFAGLEGEPDQVLPAVETLRDEYRALVAARAEGLSTMAHAAGSDLFVHTTDQSTQSAALALHQKLARGGGRS